MISAYLKEQLRLHPTMEPGDVMKWCFQTAFGAEHLLADKDAAWKYLVAEYEAVEDVLNSKCEDAKQDEKRDSESREPLYENISDTLCRVNLRPWKAKGLPLEWLFTMFVKGAEEAAGVKTAAADGAQANFLKITEEAQMLIAQGVFKFDLASWRQYLAEYPMEHPTAVHHSEGYREAEKPAYRLVPGKYIRLLPILEALPISNPLPEAEPFVIAIDGRCASGKTTMAALLAELTGAGVVHADDFFLPMELRTAERLREPGGNVHYERMIEEVLPRLKKPEAFTYGRFDCSRMGIAGERCVAAGQVRIVEGAYSCHPKLGNYMNLRVFGDVDSGEQLARIKTRDGESALQSYRERWIPMEEKYLEAFHIREKAHIIV